MSTRCAPTAAAPDASVAGSASTLTYRALQACKANINCDRTGDPPWGLHGGKPAATNRAIIRRAADGSEQVVYKATEVEIAAGDTVTFLTAGGGGYGDPAERDRDALAHDVAEGLVSPDAAATRYGGVPAATKKPAKAPA